MIGENSSVKDNFSIENKYQFGFPLDSLKIAIEEKKMFGLPRLDRGETRQDDKNTPSLEDIHNSFRKRFGMKQESHKPTAPTFDNTNVKFIERDNDDEIRGLTAYSAYQKESKAPTVDRKNIIRNRKEYISDVPVDDIHESAAKINEQPVVERKNGQFRFLKNNANIDLSKVIPTSGNSRDIEVEYENMLQLSEYDDSRWVNNVPKYQRFLLFSLYGPSEEFDIRSPFHGMEFFGVFPDEDSLNKQILYLHKNNQYFHKFFSYRVWDLKKHGWRIQLDEKTLHPDEESSPICPLTMHHRNIFETHSKSILKKLEKLRDRIRQDTLKINQQNQMMMDKSIARPISQRVADLESMTTEEAQEQLNFNPQRDGKSMSIVEQIKYGKISVCDTETIEDHINTGHYEIDGYRTEYQVFHHNGKRYVTRSIFAK